jgi:diacylglycerol kinase
LIKSFSYALRGLVKAWREEQNLQIQSVAAVFAVFLGFYFGISALEWALLTVSIALVLLMELINSGVERICDLVKPRVHDYVKEIKDIMAAAVMLSAISSVAVGLIIFWPHIAASLGGK